MAIGRKINRYVNLCMCIVLFYKNIEMRILEQIYKDQDNETGDSILMQFLVIL